MLRCLDAFADFNPLVDDIPQELERSIVFYLQQQSLALLPKSIKIDELNLGLELLDQLHGKTYFSSKKYLKSQTNPIFERGLTETTVSQYFRWFESNDDGFLKELYPYPKSNLFVTYALGCLSDYVACHTVGIELSVGFDPVGDQANEKRLIKIDDNEGEYLTSEVGLLIPEGLDALGFARVLRAQEMPGPKSVRRSESARKNHLINYGPIKRAVIAQYKKMDKPKSNRKAAKLIYEQLDESLKLKLLNEDPKHQIAVWIGQYRRGELKAFE